MTDVFFNPYSNPRPGRSLLLNTFQDGSYSKTIKFAVAGKGERSISPALE